MVSESFRQRAPAAAYWEAWVASTLTRAGLYVVCHPWVIDGKDHTFDHDLDVSCCDPLSSLSHPQTFFECEVKGISITFNSLEDYPYSTAYICSHSNHQKKYGITDKLGRDFFLVSMSTGAIVCAPKGIKTEIFRSFDSHRGTWQDTVSCYKEQLRPLQDFIEKVKG